MIFAPAVSCRASAWATLRWSFHIIARRSTVPASSVSTGICAPAEIPMPVMSRPVSPAAASACGTAAQSAAYHSAGSCSDQPNCGT
jgi:hypothetical protein